MEVFQYGTGRIKQYIYIYIYMEQHAQLIRIFFKIVLFESLIDMIKNRIVMLQI